MILLDNADVGRADTPLIRSVTLSVEPGCLIRLVGKNGVGKTTLLHTILGYLPLLGGARGPELPAPATTEHQAMFGYMPSMVPRLPSLTLPQWLDALAVGYRRERSEIQEIWDAIGGRALPTTMLDQLSSGNLRKALFTSACAIQRELLVLDEPFDEVDNEGQSAMARIIEQQRAAGAAVIVVSHREIAQLLDVDTTYEISEEHLHVVP
ncbi:ATP-binding cassette domain-containing protein [Corynebacterium yudongzhengii]|uniref:ABC transporter ATP-binding protein n=1 Tax=Corynebacterium yudongzhengii TaxID=2080740 RepID=UPI001304D89E|nr:ATP-binding cassette domain-containing protein [Corynebacterium yudongzhengii]